MPWPWMLAHSVLSLLFLVLLVTIVVAFIRAVSRDSRTARGRRSRGLAVLEERYTRGEIDRDQYLRMKRDITDHGAAAA